MEKKKTYEIGGKVYELAPPVFGVLRQVGLFCRAVEEADDSDDLLEAMGDRTAEFVALMLTPKGVILRDRDLSAIADAVEFEALGGVPEQVVDDFFGQPEASPENMIAALTPTRMLTLMVGSSRLARKAGMTPSPSSSGTSPSSPGETPSSGTKSSGGSATAT
ncbi:MAG: hypothetical protein AB7E51_06775 [Pseudodesulfovibrio sp.]|uniref:hypothetical protein n=1 Tax=Pseudodesulfovibrio sp. TaxID=2035812 RepID=UPI003D0FABA4